MLEELLHCGACVLLPHGGMLQAVGDQLSLLKLVYKLAEESQGCKTPHERSAALLTALHSLLTKIALLDSPQGRLPLLRHP